VHGDASTEGAPPLTVVALAKRRFSVLKATSLRIPGVEVPAWKSSFLTISISVMNYEILAKLFQDLWVRNVPISLNKYEIHIEDSFSDEDCLCLKDIAETHDSGIKSTDKTLIIYKGGDKDDKFVQLKN